MPSTKKTIHAKKNQPPLALQWLIETFPNAFFSRSREVRPLQIGIFDEILLFQARLTTPPFSRKALREALNYYSASPAYLRCQATDAPRLDLFGAIVDEVTEEQAKYAQQRYESRYLHAKKSQNKELKADKTNSIVSEVLESDPNQVLEKDDQHKEDALLGTDTSDPVTENSLTSAASEEMKCSVLTSEDALDNHTIENSSSKEDEDRKIQQPEDQENL